MPYKNLEQAKQHRKKYYLKNQEKFLQYQKNYRLKNPNYDKEWSLKNPEKKKKHRQKYYQENEEIIKKQMKEYQLKNKEKMKEYQLKNKEKRNKNIKNFYLKNPNYGKEWCLKNPEKKLKSQIKILTRLGKTLKLPYKEYAWALFSWAKIVKKQQGDQCVICDSKNKLHIHHIFSKAKYPKLSLNLNNGIPLCKIHHQEAHGNIQVN